MKRLTYSLSLVVAVSGMSLIPSIGLAQNNSARELPHKVGLIDMAYIFKNYKKFTDLREDLKKEIQGSDAKAKQMVAQIQTLQKQLRDPKFKDGSPQKKAWRQQLIELTAKYQSFRQEEQRKFLEKEAQVYKTVYLEVTDAVRTYAQYYNYTLILRWTRDGVDKAQDAKSILKNLNRRVIYVHKGQDITDVILQYLNERYAKSLKGTQSAGGTRRRN